MLPTNILRASVWRNVEKLLLLKCQSLSKKDEYKIEAEKRQRKCRAEKKAKQENSNTSETACPIASSNPLPNINLNTKQSYGTAAARSKEALLTSPRKKLAVVAELAFRDKNVT